MADFLLAHGADINTNWTSHEPASILHHLVFLQRSREPMQFLIDRGIDMSINKAVIYLLLASIICIGLGLFVIRGGLRMRPTGAQNVVELAYEFVEKQIARQTLPSKVYSRYFPFIATLFMFIAVNVESQVATFAARASASFSRWVVSCVVPDPSVAASQTSVRPRLAAKSVVRTVNAIRSPFGEPWGSAMRCMSATVRPL